MTEVNVGSQPMIYKPLQMYQRREQRIMCAIDPKHGKRLSITGSTLERVRDRLTREYGYCFVIIDTRWVDHDRPCTPQCMGAFKSTAWECDCPCSGERHGGENWLLNHTLVKKERLPLPFTNGRTYYMTRYYYLHRFAPTGEVTP